MPQSPPAAGFTFPQPRQYVHDVFPTLEACEAFRQRSTPDASNCSQVLTLCPTGRATITLTDIINGGTYRLRGRELVLSTSPLSGLPREIIFDVAADEQSLTERWRGGVLWVHKPSESARAASTCGP
jgi:hypothetical protein